MLFLLYISFEFLIIISFIAFRFFSLPTDMKWLSFSFLYPFLIYGIYIFDFIPVRFSFCDGVYTCADIYLIGK